MKDKISITLDEKLMKYIDIIRGDIPRSKFIENYLRDSSGLFEAVWIFSDELKKVNWRSQFSAHTSQPLGKPLHKHEGFIGIVPNEIKFYDGQLLPLFNVAKKDAKKIKVGYDDNFKRFGDSRGLMPPLHFSFDKKTIYIFTRQIGKVFFTGNDEEILRKVK